MIKRKKKCYNIFVTFSNTVEECCGFSIYMIFAADTWIVFQRRMHKTERKSVKNNPLRLLVYLFRNIVLMGLLPDTYNCGLRMSRECWERFPRPPRVSDPDMHHGTCVTHVPWYMPGSLASGFHWSRWRGKRSRHSRRMRNPQFYVSGKRPMVCVLATDGISFCYHRIHLGPIILRCITWERDMDK